MQEDLKATLTAKNREAKQLSQLERTRQRNPSDRHVIVSFVPIFNNTKINRCSYYVRLNASPVQFLSPYIFFSWRDTVSSCFCIHLTCYVYLFVYHLALLQPLTVSGWFTNNIKRRLPPSCSSLVQNGAAWLLMGTSRFEHNSCSTGLTLVAHRFLCPIQVAGLNI